MTLLHLLRNELEKKHAVLFIISAVISLSNYSVTKQSVIITLINLLL